MSSLFACLFHIRCSLQNLRVFYTQSKSGQYKFFRYLHFQLQSHPGRSPVKRSTINSRNPLSEKVPVPIFYYNNHTYKRQLKRHSPKPHGSVRLEGWSKNYFMILARERPTLILTQMYKHVLTQNKVKSIT